MTRLEELKNLLLENPKDNFLSYALALELAKLNRVDEAIQQLVQLLERDPDYLAAYYQLGKYYEMNQEIAKAVATFSKGMDVALMKMDQRTLAELSTALDLLED